MQIKIKLFFTVLYIRIPEVHIEGKNHCSFSQQRRTSSKVANLDEKKYNEIRKGILCILKNVTELIVLQVFHLRLLIHPVLAV